MQTKNHRSLFSGLVVGIEQMDVLVGDKGWHTFQAVRHPGGAAVLPLHGDGSVTLIRQLRPPIGADVLEIPAGRLSPGEDPAEAARRELLEETGLVPGNLEPLGILLPAPGYCDEKIHLFLATDLTQGEAEPEAYEEISAVRMSLEEAVRLAVEGEISDAKTLAALVRARERRR